MIVEKFADTHGKIRCTIIIKYEKDEIKNNTDE